MRSRKGFTLIELMIVVAILALLSAIAIPLYQGYIVDARKTEAKTNLMAIRLLEEQYYSDNGVYLAGEYSVDAETLKTGLKGFEPKPAADLHYSYIVAPGTGASPSYTATATLKYDAEKFFSITDDNVRLNEHDRSW